MKYTDRQRIQKIYDYASKLQAYNLSKEYKSAHSEIPWAMIAGLRHRLVHDYDGTSWEIISDVVLEEIPALVEQLKNLGENI